MCESGRRGQKNGRGYYTYDPETRAATPDPEVEQIIKDFAVGKGIEQREVSDQEVLERCLYSMVNEGAKILEEGIAIRGSDIDVDVGQRLRLAGLSRWPDALGRLGRTGRDRREGQGLQRVARRPPLGTVATARTARRRRRPAQHVHELITVVTTQRSRGPPLPPAHPHFDPSDPDFRRRVRTSFDSQAMMRTLGIELVDLGPGWVELEFDHDDAFTQQHGYTHAGAIRDRRSIRRAGTPP